MLVTESIIIEWKWNTSGKEAAKTGKSLVILIVILICDKCGLLDLDFEGVN